MNYDPNHPNHKRILPRENIVNGDYVNCSTGLARLPKAGEKVTHRVAFVVERDQTPFAYCMEVKS